jgi:general secretion pathway protein G
MKRHIGGFSFIELLAALAVMAVLAMMTLPVLQIEQQRQKEQKLVNALMEIREAIDAYRRAADAGRVPFNKRGYPATLLELSTGVADQTQPDRKMIYFLRRVPRDPFHPDLTISAEDSWQTRSADAPPDAPHSGDDVFDVYSSATGVGMNGVPYAQW